MEDCETFGIVVARSKHLSMLCRRLYNINFSLLSLTSITNHSASSLPSAAETLGESPIPHSVKKTNEPKKVNVRKISLRPNIRIANWLDQETACGQP